MKRILLASTMILGVTAAQSQIITHVLQPAALEGGLTFTWPSDWSSPPVPDLNVAGTHVQGYAVIGRDSLGCTALTNAANVAGKIAFIWRGDCEFGLKALNAQNAGAIGVVIVNNQGAPVGMAAGASGGQVTIPVVMISTDDGNNLHSALEAGQVEMFIGNKLEFFDTDLGITAASALVPKYASVPSLIAQNGSEYSFNVGAWVANWGSVDQTNVTLNATVNQGGNTPYNETSNAFNLASGDSIYVELPPVALSSYSGTYTFNYVVNASTPDEFTSDNTISTTFNVSSRLSYGSIDTETDLPQHDQFVRPSSATQGYRFCSHLLDPNSSRLTVTGIHTAATAPTGGTLVGTAITGSLFEWTAPFNDLSEDFDNSTALVISELATETYYFDEDLGGENIFIEFPEPVQLQDNRRYLFCATTSTLDMYLGYQDALTYRLNSDEYLQPQNVINSLGVSTWYTGFTGGGTVTVAGQFATPENVGQLNKVDVTPYPNPARDLLRIPSVKGSGKAQLDIMDITGKLVKTQQVNMPGNDALVVDLSGVSNGTYTFRMLYNDGSISAFKVVVNR